MRTVRLFGTSVFTCALVGGVITPSWAQQTGTIAGTVKDATGAVLPGVTVEAASPALIEKVRSVVTDGEGLYKIIELRPGTYTLTYTLPGFSTFRRDGVDLSAGFTATVNADMRLGDVAESITVTGQAPLVDVQNATQSRVVTREVMESIPTSRHVHNLAALVPGVQTTNASQQDVGGNASNRIAQHIVIHGSRGADLPALFDGMAVHNMHGRAGGGNTGWFFNPGNIAELNIEVGAIGTASEVSGVTINLIPREGGNTFSSLSILRWANSSLQANNIDSDLQAAGLQPGAALSRMYEFNPSVGGPILRDKLWFYGSFYRNYYDNTVPGAFFAKDPAAFIYVPDRTRPAHDEILTQNYSGRVTWQPSPRNKLAFYYDDSYRCSCHFNVSPFLTPEATIITPPNDTVSWVAQATWNAPVTNRLLLQGGFLYHYEIPGTAPQPGLVGDQYMAVRDLGTGITSRSTFGTYFRSISTQYEVKGALNYVTGSHAFKVGMSFMQGTNKPYYYTNGDMNLVAVNGVPSEVQVWTTPYTQIQKLKWKNVYYAQDQWKIRRLTLNPGVRFDFLNAYVAEQHIPATRFIGPRDFAPVLDVPNWKDISPRVSAVYDLFGDGKTALKASAGRYLIGIVTLLAANNNPITTSVNSTTRSWTDLNGDFSPQEGELGPLANANFGKVSIVNRYDPDVLSGWGKRPYDWETTAGVQHQVTDSISATATYIRHWYANKYVIDNTKVTPADYDPFCITAPVDARLPTSGQRLCGFYDITPAKFGQVDNFITFAKHYGDQQEVFEGVDVSLSVRLPRGMILQGGTATGRTRSDDCFVVDSPGLFNPEPGFFSGIGNRLRDCAVRPPFLTQVKLLGVYPLPWGISASATFQSIPGRQILANYAVTSAEVAQSLGRPLAGGLRTLTVPLVTPETLYSDRLNQLDVRFAKTITMRGLKLQPQIDLFNALNDNTVLALNNTYGRAWQNPQNVLPGRLVQLGLQVTF
jgi:hypothetical protein